MDTAFRKKLRELGRCTGCALGIDVPCLGKLQYTLRGNAMNGITSRLCPAGKIGRMLQRQAGLPLLAVSTVPDPVEIFGDQGRTSRTRG